jgi:integrative and conjugative element protein (TIGR02256 family)
MPMWAPGNRRLEPGRLWVFDSVIAQLVAEANRMAPLETGGVLLGWGVEGDEVVVADAIGPGARAVHRRHRFEPDSRWQRREITEAYERSGRVHRYLGDWHSHPGGGSNPSGRDRRTARRISRHRASRARQPVMLILSDAHDSWKPVPYRLLRGKLIEMVFNTAPNRCSADGGR